MAEYCYTDFSLTEIGRFSRVTKGRTKYLQSPPPQLYYLVWMKGTKRTSVESTWLGSEWGVRLREQLRRYSWASDSELAGFPQTSRTLRTLTGGAQLSLRLAGIFQEEARGGAAWLWLILHQTQKRKAVAWALGRRPVSNSTDSWEPWLLLPERRPRLPSCPPTSRGYGGR